MRRVYCLFAFAALLAGGCSGIGTMAGSGGDPSRPVTLRINLKAGEKQSQTTDVEINGSAQGKTFSSKIHQVTDQEVVSASGGKFAVKTTISEATATGDNADATNAKLADLKGKSFTITMDDHGKALDMGGMENDPLLGQFVQNAKFGELPDKPVKPGDTWTVNAQMMGMAVTGEMKSLGIEMVNGKEALKIEANIKVPMLPNPVKTTQWIDVATGLPLKLESENDVNIAGTQVHTKTTMTAR